MDLLLDGKTALVAAATRGLGLATATALAAEGARVVLTGRHDETVHRAAAALPRAGRPGAAGGAAAGIVMDVTDEDSRARALQQARETVGPIDILVINGPGPQPGTASAMSADALADAFRLLVAPARHLVAALLPGMRECGWGRILAIGSSSIVAPLPNLAASNTGRAALAGYLKTVASEAARDGVTVNMLLPGRIATDRVAALDAAKAEREGTSIDLVRQRSHEAIPAGRYGTPAEFGAAAAFLCSGPASYITGVALRCDGGLTRSL